MFRARTLTPRRGGGTLGVPRCGFGFRLQRTRSGAPSLSQIAAGMADWLSRNGATVLEHTRVVSVDPEEGRLQLERGDSIVADRVVVTAGAWVPKLFPKLVADLTTYRTAVVYLEPPADLKAAWEKAPVILDVGGETDGYIIPPTGGAGLKFGSGLHKEATDDPSANRAPRPSEGDKIPQSLRTPDRRIEGLRRSKENLSCACTFNRGRGFLLPMRPGAALVVSACSGHVLQVQGAAVGRRVADAVEG